MDNKERDLFRMQHILECAEKIEIITNQLGVFEVFMEKWIEQDAMVRNFEIIGEAANHISDNLKTKHPDVEWQKIRGMRNLIAHEYFGVKAETIWETAITVIPVFRKQIKSIIKSLK